MSNRQNKLDHLNYSISYLHCHIQLYDAHIPLLSTHDKSLYTEPQPDIVYLKACSRKPIRGLPHGAICQNKKCMGVDDYKYVFDPI